MAIGPFQELLKILAAAGSGPHYRFWTLRRSSPTVEEIKRCNVVVTFDALVECMAQVISISFALLGLGKLFHDNIEFVAQPLLAPRRHPRDFVRNATYCDGD